MPLRQNLQEPPLAAGYSPSFRSRRQRGPGQRGTRAAFGDCWTTATRAAGLRRRKRHPSVGASERDPARAADRQCSFDRGDECDRRARVGKRTLVRIDPRIVPIIELDRRGCVQQRLPLPNRPNRSANRLTVAPPPARHSAAISAAVTRKEARRYPMNCRRWRRSRHSHHRPVAPCFQLHLEGLQGAKPSRKQAHPPTHVSGEPQIARLRFVRALHLRNRTAL